MTLTQDETHSAQRDAGRSSATTTMPASVTDVHQPMPSNSHPITL